MNPIPISNSTKFLSKVRNRPDEIDQMRMRTPHQEISGVDFQVHPGRYETVCGLRLKTKGSGYSESFIETRPRVRKVED